MRPNVASVARSIASSRLRPPASGFIPNTLCESVSRSVRTCSSTSACRSTITSSRPTRMYGPLSPTVSLARWRSAKRLHPSASERQRPRSLSSLLHTASLFHHIIRVYDV